jgi:hypothetical protein
MVCKECERLKGRIKELEGRIEEIRAFSCQVLWHYTHGRIEEIRSMTDQIVAQKEVEALEAIVNDPNWNEDAATA